MLQKWQNMSKIYQFCREQLSLRNKAKPKWAYFKKYSATCGSAIWVNWAQLSGTASAISQLCSKKNTNLQFRPWLCFFHHFLFGWGCRYKSNCSNSPNARNVSMPDYRLLFFSTLLFANNTIIARRDRIKLAPPKFGWIDEKGWTKSSWEVP